MAIECDIRDAVIAELNSGSRSWTGEFTATGIWLPVYDQADLASLKVAVVPLTLETEDETRSKERWTYGIGIDFQKSLNPQDATFNDSLDDLCDLVEDVHDFYRDKHALATLTDWKVLAAKRDAIYSLEMLYAEHTFESIIVLAVRGNR